MNADKNKILPSYDLTSWDESMRCILRGATHVQGNKFPLIPAETRQCAGSAGVLPPVRWQETHSPGFPL